MPKALFGTSDKSNFILNMKKDTVKKWVTGLLCACILLPLIGGLFITFIPKANSFLGTFLYMAGFPCFCFYLILLLRKDIRFKDYPCAFLVTGLAVLTFASYYRVVLSGSGSESVMTAMLGETGRYEGLLALFSYFGIFLLATTVAKRSTVKMLFDIFVGAGIVQGFIAVLQHIPCSFPSDFRKLPSILLLKEVHLSSGLADSPIFYGSFLTLAAGTAAVGAIYDKNITRARIYGFAAVFMFMTGLFTSSAVPLIGTGTAMVIIAVYEFFINRESVKFEDGRLRTSKIRLAALLCAMAAVFGTVLAVQGIYLRDKAIAYSDAFSRLFIVSAPSPVNKDSLWKIGAERSFIIIKKHPLLGTGPDLMAKFQFMSGDSDLIIDSIDRSYNEYLYTAATRGIPAMLVYLALLGMTFVQLFKKMKEFSADREKWYLPALLTTVLAYSVQAFFSASAITVAPFFWLLLGMAWSKFKED